MARLAERWPLLGLHLLLAAGCPTCKSSLSLCARSALSKSSSRHIASCMATPTRSLVHLSTLCSVLSRASVGFTPQWNPGWKKQRPFLLKNKMTKTITDRQFQGYIERTWHAMRACIDNNWINDNDHTLEEILSECKSLIDEGHIDLNMSYINPLDNTRTLLTGAAEAGQARHIRLLVEYGADLNSEGSNGYGLNPLHIAVMSGNIDAVKVLLELGAATETRGYGRTALWEAAYRGHTEIVSLLVDAGANLEALGHHDKMKTPLQISKTKEVREILLRAGAKPAEESA